MRNVSLAQFQSITGISDAALCLLLKKNLLPCSYHPEAGLSIDISSVEIRTLVDAIAERMATPAPAVQEMINERVGGLIADSFERVCDEALKRLGK